MSEIKRFIRNTIINEFSEHEGCSDHWRFNKENAENHLLDIRNLLNDNGLSETLKLEEIEKTFHHHRLKYSDI